MTTAWNKSLQDDWMGQTLNALHLTDRHREVSVWIKAVGPRRYSYEIVLRRFDNDRFDEDFVEPERPFSDPQIAVEAAVVRAVALYHNDEGR
jgi:hypothetical protein